MPLPIVAIVGQPNVGKSTLFNRIINERVAIVEDRPGVTRDRNYARASWMGHQFSIIDTGGITWEDSTIDEEIRAQAEIAIEEANVIVMLADASQGVTSLDERIAHLLYRADKPVLLAVNKADNPEQRTDIYDFYSLGLGDPIPVSGSHGTGIGDLLDEVVKNFSADAEKTEEGVISFSVIGRPNVGKSSIVNRLLGEERVIVANEEGTTRDAIDTPFVKDGTKFRVVDTAGIRRRGKVYEKTEKYSVMRAMSAMERSDVAILVLDASTGIREQDKHVAGYAHEAGLGMIIAVNKWDLPKKDSSSGKDFEAVIREEFSYLDYAPIVFVSAKTGKNIDQLPKMVKEVYENKNQRIQSSVLNDLLLEASRLVPAPMVKGKRLRVYYMTQVKTNPPTFVVFCNDPELMHFSYQRFLINQLRENFDFTGTPIKILPRKRK
ncbi:ribosome biogenesis GTPase Der [Lactobacillus delbrueckii subsp. bulgaricus]|uniref:ribosome biogenesis GTPase Der n=1 Tax=Lactobacillus delbrueckii TaxID=1584 RepID=UPI001BFF1C29|nr:ribosome biogenesis GTPase Der [Lactobacillus delbrueckii]MBT8801695.1 ribosome biogenesis GTPase Der [Lactobacillus delbrueckii subsp. bulgaricus]MBT8805016.1 ribosome biogenesis GTPase Der [Lactobacillus delbrueckii subsp. bulgaricus]MBT8814278.1 ribosome biogenesis GTPase Der [Lactobacillus delbrueckii subsp. bulgaricus]MBT8838219.1 ribosome biogenesis GTPase Der [Lactobacillus delbrueckii subsp. bulgaricus]MBT8855670.1 ribosome biogenesis GTPase Der [Lactobacillus delbrueckii subsp. bul